MPSLDSAARFERSTPRTVGVAVFVVPVPPFVRRSLRVAFRRVFPLLLAPERSHIEVAPGAPERLVAAVVDKVGAEHAVAIADERVRAVPLVYAEVFVEVVRDGVPRNAASPSAPSHARCPPAARVSRTQV